MSDYLDAMIKAHDEVMYAAGTDCWSPKRRREAMMAAYNVAQTMHWGNPLAKLIPGQINKTVGDGVALMSMAHPIQSAELLDEPRNVEVVGEIERSDTNPNDWKFVSKVVCKDPEQERRDRIWAAVQAASGGSG